MTQFFSMPAKKILVADDSLTIQKVIRLALSNEGYDIQAVSDGNDAVQQIAVFRPDVVLIDVSLPGKSAFDVKRITDGEQSSSHVRFVLMSSAFEKVDEQQVRELKFHGQLTKPFDPAHLRKVLSDVLAGAPTATPLPSQGHATRTPSPPPASLPPEIPAEMPLQVRPSLSDEISLELPPELPIDLSAENLPEVPPEIPLSSPNSLPGDFDLPPPPSGGGMSLDLPPFEMQPPVQPNEDLWGTNSPPPSQFPPAGAIPELQPKSEDSDIRHLTESTIRMSGLDDFDWSVNEPSLKPSSNIADISNANFPFDEPAQQLREFPREFPSMPGASIPLSPKKAMDEGLQLQQPEISSPLMSQEAMEQLIQKEVHSALESVMEKFAQRILPDIAERVIKQEIHRLLSEQP